MFKYIWFKEVKESLSTWKGMLWLFVSSLIFSFTSYLLLTDKELSLLDQTELLWLLSKVIIGVAILIVAIDASSIITSEFEKETAESLFITPLKLKDLLLGKLLASLTLWGQIYIVAVPYMVVTSMGSGLLWGFAGYVALLGSLGITAMVMVIFAISLLYRSSKNTLTTSLIILLALSIPAFFSSTLTNNPMAQFFGVVNPVDNIFSSLDNVLVDYHQSLLQNWNYLLPLLLFLIASAVFMFFAAKRFQKEGVIKND